MSCCRSKLYLVLVPAIAGRALAFHPATDEGGPGKPTAEREALLKDVGEWEGTVTIHDVPGMEAPVAARETVRGIGGFWVLSGFRSEFLGAPYVGSGHIGYDPRTKRSVGTWVDSMSSYFSHMTGEYDAAKTAVVMRCDAPDMTGTMTPHRSETVVSGDTRTMTFFAGVGEGKKSMVIAMKRAKPAAGGK